MDDLDPKWAWKDGSFVPYDECVLHVRTQAVMLGASIFEGIKAYWNANTSALNLFRLEEHLQRLRESMKIMRMRDALPPNLGEICQELLVRNSFSDDVHLMPTVYTGTSQGNAALGRAMYEGAFVTGTLRPRSQSLEHGLQVCVSSWTRISDNSVPPRIKAAGNYQNSRLALNEAWVNGYDNAILLNSSGTVSEGPSAIVMMVRHGQICTPPVTAGILESITRDTLITLFREKLGRTVIERPIDRTELYTADEIFMCGSGMEVVPVISVDRINVGSGCRGPLTEAIQNAYFAVATGEDSSHPEWRTTVTMADRCKQ
jgi:branched-chain amino acid aminotransferase